jgi:hypothetical protein
MVEREAKVAGNLRRRHTDDRCQHWSSTTGCVYLSEVDTQYFRIAGNPGVMHLQTGGLESAQMCQYQTALPPGRYGLVEARVIIQMRTCKEYPIGLGTGPMVGARRAKDEVG